jgi:3-oxoacyl-[acyl-carrier protein] reductase
MVAAASKGIGFAVAQALIEEGATISICARNKESLDLALRQLGEDAIGYVCDVTRPDQIENWHKQTTIRLGSVDILVTNTGGPAAGKLDDLTDAQWLDGFESTVMNIVRLTRLVSPSMIERKWGRIVHVTSLVAFHPNENLPISTTLRSGIRGLTRLQSDLLAPHNITVNAVLPGHTKTDRQKHLAQLHQGTEEEYFDTLAENIPLRRLAEPREIADAVAFLCSERASYITGVSLLVDGGITRAF